MDGQSPPSDSPEKRTDLGSVLGRFLPLEAAACWIAFGHFERTGCDWPAPLSFIFDEDGSFVREELSKNEGRYWLAFEMLTKAVANGLVAAYGHYYEPEPGEEADPRAEDVLADGRTRKILPDEAQKAFMYLGNEDEPLVVGEHIYDHVVVNWHDLLAVFSPLNKRLEVTPLQVPIPPHGSGQAFLESNMSIPKRGRPPKWDWDRIILEIILLANQPNGLPDTQSELERWVAEKCNEIFGSEPGLSTIKTKIGPIYQRLRSKSQ